MNEIITCQGKAIKKSDLLWLQEIVNSHPNWSQHRITKLICDHWNWRTQTGQLKTFAARSLIDKHLHEASVLAFLHDKKVPFTNNLAEQDIRMIKDRLEISGCFRTLQGAKNFARIRIEISTARKQACNILDAITDSVVGQPLIPSISQ